MHTRTPRLTHSLTYTYTHFRTCIHITHLLVNTPIYITHLHTYIYIIYIYIYIYIYIHIHIYRNTNIYIYIDLIYLYNTFVIYTINILGFVISDCV